MEKPIIATNLDGLLIKHEAFIEPHKAWFDRAIKKTGDKSLGNWKGREDYFEGVNMAMEKIMPEANTEQKTSQARKWYQEDVIEYIKAHPKIIITKSVKKLKKLRKKYQLILITTNSEDYINRILQVSGLSDIYDFVIASRTEQDPNKRELINELIKRYGVPEYYITGKEDAKTEDIFKKSGTKIINEKELDKIYLFSNIFKM